MSALLVNSLSLPATAFEPIQATGGDISDITVDGVTYRVHTFRNTGSTNFVVSDVGNGDGVVEYLIAAGGGSGGGGFNNFASGGGGGGGGVLIGNVTVTATTYAAIVGAGGAAVSGNIPGNAGSNSSVFGQTAVGGGRGGCWQTTGTATNAGSGGSGGGGANASGASDGAAGTTAQGTAGGNGLTYTGNINSGGGGGGVLLQQDKIPQPQPAATAAMESLAQSLVPVLCMDQAAVVATEILVAAEEFAPAVAVVAM